MNLVQKNELYLTLFLSCTAFRALSSDSGGFGRGGASTFSLCICIKKMASSHTRQTMHKTVTVIPCQLDRQCSRCSFLLSETSHHQSHLERDFATAILSTNLANLCCLVSETAFSQVAQNLQPDKLWYCSISPCSINATRRTQR